MCSSAPDTSGMNAAAVSQTNLSAEQLAWAKQIYADTAPDRAAATTNANAISGAQLTAMNTQTGLASDLATYNKGTFQPLEKSIVADAQAYDTPDRVAANVGRAEADVNSGFSNAEAQQQRSLARMGVNPSSGRALALGNQTAIAQAASLAGASNKARLDTETIGAAKKMDAASLGRNLPAAQATTAGLAVNAGNASLASGVMPVNIDAQGNQIMTSGFNGSMAATQSAGNLYGQIAQIQGGGNNSSNALLGGLGNVVGGYAGSNAGSSQIAGWLSSSKTLKHNKRPMSSGAALKGINGLKVEQWDYKKGVADSGTHIGPYAEDVRKGLGDSVAPGGKMLNMAEVGRANTMAIKALLDKATRLESELTRIGA